MGGVLGACVSASLVLLAPRRVAPARSVVEMGGIVSVPDHCQSPSSGATTSCAAATNALQGSGPEAKHRRHATAVIWGNTRCLGSPSATNAGLGRIPPGGRDAHACVHARTDGERVAV